MKFIIKKDIKYSSNHPKVSILTISIWINPFLFRGTDLILVWGDIIFMPVGDLRNIDIDSVYFILK